MGLKGYRLWDMGQHDSTCSAPPKGRTSTFLVFLSITVASFALTPVM
jgi:hypothetical protein